jgi:serine/threonine protein kinase
MFALLTDCPLFEVFGFGRSPDVINDDHLIELSEIIGPLPCHMRNAWSRYSLYFGPNRERLDARPSDFDDSEMGRTLKAHRPAGGLGPPTLFPSLEDKFFQYKPNDMNDEEARELASLLRNILQIEPSQRPSAAQLLEKQWFRM